MNFPTMWGHRNIENTALLMFSFTCVAASMAGEATPVWGNIAVPGEILEPQVDERGAASGMQHIINCL